MKPAVDVHLVHAQLDLDLPRFTKMFVELMSRRPRTATRRRNASSRKSYRGSATSHRRGGRRRGRHRRGRHRRGRHRRGRRMSKQYGLNAMIGKWPGVADHYRSHLAPVYLWMSGASTPP